MSGVPRVMVVDDEPDILTVLEMYLKKCEFEADTFASPMRALEHFKKNASSYSVILTDVRMPGMTGLELAGRMMEIRPDIKILLMTAFDITSEELSRCLPTMSHQDLIEKPFQMPHVCQEIQKRLQ